jgi:hypothetical protein
MGDADEVVRLTKDFKRITDAVGVRARAERVYTVLKDRNDQVVCQVELDRLADWANPPCEQLHRPAHRRQAAPEAVKWPLTCGFVLTDGYRWCPNCTVVVLRL